MVDESSSTWFWDVFSSDDDACRLFFLYLASSPFLITLLRTPFFLFLSALHLPCRFLLTSLRRTSRALRGNRTPTTYGIRIGFSDEYVHGASSSSLVDWPIAKPAFARRTNAEQ